MPDQMRFRTDCGGIEHLHTRSPMTAGMSITSSGGTVSGAIHFRSCWTRHRELKVLRRPLEVSLKQVNRSQALRPEKHCRFAHCRRPDCRSVGLGRGERRFIHSRRTNRRRAIAGEPTLVHRREVPHRWIIRRRTARLVKLSAPAGGAPTAGMLHAGQLAAVSCRGGILAGGQPEMGGLPAEPGCVPPVAIF